VRAWIADLLGLPPEVEVGSSTGATMANFTAWLRHGTRSCKGKAGRRGQGLFGAPTITVIVATSACEVC